MRVDAVSEGVVVVGCEEEDDDGSSGERDGSKSSRERFAMVYSQKEGRM